MSQVVLFPCVVPANMVLQRNVHIKLQTLALWLALCWILATSCQWIKWLQAVQLWYLSPVDIHPTINTSLSPCGLITTQGSYMCTVKKMQQSNLLLNPRKILKCLQNDSMYEWSISTATMGSSQPRLSVTILMHVINSNCYVELVLTGKTESLKGTLVLSQANPVPCSCTPCRCGLMSSHLSSGALHSYMPSISITTHHIWKSNIPHTLCLPLRMRHCLLMIFEFLDLQCMFWTAVSKLECLVLASGKRDLFKESTSVTPNIMPAMLSWFTTLQPNWCLLNIMLFTMSPLTLYN